MESHIDWFQWLNWFAQHYSTDSLDIDPCEDCPTGRLDAEEYKRRSTDAEEDKAIYSEKQSINRESLHPYTVFWVYWNWNLLRSASML